MEEGEKDISQFVSKWTLDECWLYCIDYMECIETEFGKNHHYNVKFSIPTRQKPVPSETASVFFVLTESKVGSPKYVYFYINLRVQFSTEILTVNSRKLTY